MKIYKRVFLAAISLVVIGQICSFLKLEFVPTPVFESLRSNAEYRWYYGRPPPKLYDRWISHATERNCSLKPEPYARIYANLQVFRDSHAHCVAQGKCQPTDPIITPELIRRASSLGSISVLTIQNGTFHYGDDDFTRSVREALETEVKWLPDMRLVFSHLDEPRILRKHPVSTNFSNLSFDDERQLFTTTQPASVADLMKQVCLVHNDSYLGSHGFFIAADSFSVSSDLLPVFSATSISNCFADIIYPSHYFWKQQESVSWSNSVKYEEKKDTVHWRGSTTGVESFAANEWRQNHRHRFVKSMHKNFTYPRVKIDVGFTRVLQCDGETCAEAAMEYGPLYETKTTAEAMQHKYLVDIDGNTFSQRFLTFLRHTGSLIFKIGLFDDWVTDQTVEGEHYLRVKMDFSNLRDQLRWAHRHQEQAAMIAKNAQEFAREHLRRDDMSCYMSRLLLEYHALTLPSGSQ